MLHRLLSHTPGCTRVSSWNKSSVHHTVQRRRPLRQLALLATCHAGRPSLGNKTDGTAWLAAVGCDAAGAGLLQVWGLLPDGKQKEREALWSADRGMEQVAGWRARMQAWSKRRAAGTGRSLPPSHKAHRGPSPIPAVRPRLQPCPLHTGQPLGLPTASQPLDTSPLNAPNGPARPPPARHPAVLGVGVTALPWSCQGCPHCPYQGRHGFGASGHVACTLFALCDANLSQGESSPRLHPHALRQGPQPRPSPQGCSHPLPHLWHLVLHLPNPLHCPSAQTSLLWHLQVPLPTHQLTVPAASLHCLLSPALTLTLVQPDEEQ